MFTTLSKSIACQRAQMDRLRSWIQMVNLKALNFSTTRQPEEVELEVVVSIMVITAVTMEETIMLMARIWETIAINFLSTTIKVVELIMYRRNSSTDLPASIRKSESFTHAFSILRT
jgi:hypothetical protein